MNNIFMTSFTYYFYRRLTNELLLDFYPIVGKRQGSESYSKLISSGSALQQVEIFTNRKKIQHGRKVSCIKIFLVEFVSTQPQRSSVFCE